MRSKRDLFELSSSGMLGLLLLSILHMLATAGCGGVAADLKESARLQLPEGTVSATGNLLVAQYTISTPAHATVAIQFGPTTTYGLQTSPQDSSAEGGAANILVAGMKQNTLYHMRAVVTYDDGSQQWDNDHTFQTGAIPPARVPKMTATTPSGRNPTPGVELISLTPGSTNQLLALAVDPAGSIIWYCDYDGSLGIPQPIKLLPNGHMLMVLYLVGSPGGTVQEVDLA